MKINITHAQGRVPVAVMAPEGDLDGSNYQELIAAGQKLCDAGTKAAVLDLSRVEFLSSAGLLAIHSVALLLSGQRPPDPEGGWGAFHEMAKHPSDAPSLKLAGPGPGIIKILNRSGFDTIFEIYPAADAAVAAF
jgi:anti-anti-sigma regulatory factor